MAGDGGTPGQGGDRGSSGAEAGPGGLGRLTGRRPRPGVARRGGCPGGFGEVCADALDLPHFLWLFLQVSPTKMATKKGERERQRGEGRDGGRAGGGRRGGGAGKKADLASP